MIIRDFQKTYTVIRIREAISKTLNVLALDTFVYL